MRRREFITLLGGAAAAWPLAARAQQGGRMRRVGVLQATSRERSGNTGPHRGVSTGTCCARMDGGPRHLDRLSLCRRGRCSHQGLCGGDSERGAGPDPCPSTPVVAALRQGTPVPIVFVQVTDPIGQGFVVSLARPGGNITGFTNFEPAMGSKWLEMLKEIAPGLARVALMFNPDTAPFVRMFWQPVEDAAPSFDVKPIQAPVRDAGEIEHAIEAFARDANGGLMVLPDISTANHRDLIIALAARHRLPAVYPYRYFAANGGLISYGSDVADVYRRAASYVDRILKGEKPSALPVQAPAKYELVINLKTAKTLGLDVPPTLLAPADEVIE